MTGLDVGGANFYQSSFSLFLFLSSTPDRGRHGRFIKKKGETVVVSLAFGANYCDILQ